MELFTTFTLSEIIICIILLALAIKGLVTFYDWAIDRLRKFFAKEQEQTKEQEQIQKQQESIQKLFKQDEKINDQLNTLQQSINLLVKSDIESTKSYIVERYHHFMNLQSIDTYSLDCIDKRFANYQKEGGNTFVEDLVKELNDLPKIAPMLEDPIETIPAVQSET